MSVVSFFPANEGDGGILPLVSVVEAFPASSSPCVGRGLSGRGWTFLGPCGVTDFEASSVTFSDCVIAIAAVVPVGVRGPLK